MDPRTGKLINEKDMTEKQRQTFVPVIRDLKDYEKNNMQIKLYSPCACGSGKKFKFCCRVKD